MSDGKARSLSDIYRENREPLWAFWLGGEAALKKLGLPEDSGAALVCRYAASGDPTALGVLGKQCCGNPPQGVEIGGDAIAPGQIFGVITATGAPVAVPTIPGLAGPARDVAVPAAGSPGSSA